MMKQFLSIFKGEDKMKKIITILMLGITLLSFAEVNDEINILNDNDKIKIEEKVDEVSKNTGLNVYLNYLKDAREPQLKKEEKSVIINIVKNNSQVDVAVNFTQDIPIEDYTEDINATLDNLNEFMVEGKTLAYTTALLSSIEESVVTAEKNSSIEDPNVSDKGSVKWKAFLLGFIVVGLFFYRKKFKK